MIFKVMVMVMVNFILSENNYDVYHILCICMCSSLSRQALFGGGSISPHVQMQLKSEKSFLLSLMLTRSFIIICNEFFKASYKNYWKIKTFAVKKLFLAGHPLHYNTICNIYVIYVNTQLCLFNILKYTNIRSLLAFAYLCHSSR